MQLVILLHQVLGQGNLTLHCCPIHFLLMPDIRIEMKFL